MCDEGDPSDDAEDGDDWDCGNPYQCDSHVASEWVGALEAVHLLSRAYRGDEPAKSTILSRLQDEVMDARAAWVIEEADIGPIPVDEIAWGMPSKRQSHPGQCSASILRKARNGLPVELPEDFFSLADGWRLIPAEVVWRTGFIVLRRPTEFRYPNQRRKNSNIVTRRLVWGLLLNRSEIAAIAGLSPEVSVPRTVGGEGPLRGTMPDGASPNDRKYEAMAHAAAEVVRQAKVLRSEAFRRVTEGTAQSGDDSALRAIRRAYNLMYNAWGIPHPK